MARKTIVKLIDLYRMKNAQYIDDAMSLFSDTQEIEMIGIGATVPGAYEWFQGKDEIREIILSDWANWGNVLFDLETLQIGTIENVSWFRVCAQLEQVESNKDTWEFFLSQMKSLLEEPEKSSSDQMFNATHYGLRRLYEKNLGDGHMWNMVVTGVLIKEDNQFKFTQIHWSMPVE